MNNIHDKLLPILEEEITRATEIYGRLNSRHEAYAVILEELEEAHASINSTEHFLNAYWRCVKLNKNAKSNLEIICRHAMLAAAELIQVATVAERARRQEQEMANENNNH